MTKVTLFTSLYDKRPHYREASDVLKLIKDNEKQKALIEQIRITADKDARNLLKKELPIICFGGRFKERKNDALIEASRLVVLDFDDVLDVVTKKTELMLLPFVYAVWLSPGPSGLKALVKVSSDNHLGHFKALSKDITGVDESGKDISRACFMSYDKDIYVNEVADTYNRLVEEAYTDEQKFEKLKKWLENKGTYFVSGNRNNFLAKLVGACNRFGLSKGFVEGVILREYCGGDFAEREAKGVINSMYSKTEEHGIANFEESFTEAKVGEILSSEITTKDIVTAIEVKQDLLDDFDNDTKRGGTTHLPELDEHFRWMKKELTILTGHANFGKTSMLLQLMLFKSVYEGVKWSTLSMEQYPPTFFYRELIRTLIGKPIEKDASGRMTRAEYLRGLDFVNTYFFYIYPEKDAATPEWTQGRFLESVIKHGVQGAVIDPHSAQAHDYRSQGGARDLYLVEMLRGYQRFAIQNDLYFVDVAHPKGIGKNDDGTFKEPSADDVGGGSSWWQVCDNMLVFHRPSMPLDFQDTTCTLKSTKIKKQQLNGTPGLTTLQYDRKKGRYYENGYNPLNDFVL